jgi:3D (Asp-Asp-Asp) domain-containing protein
MRSTPTRSARSQRTQHLIAAFVPALILFLSVTGFVWAQKQVTIVVDGRSLHVSSQAADVGGLLADAGVPAGADDLVFPPRSTKLVNGLNVVVRHAVPVTLVLGEERNSLHVVGKAVADALVAAGIDPAAASGVEPGVEAPLSAGMTISVPGCFARMSSETTEVPFPVETHPDGMLPRGATRVIRSGASGSALRVYRTLVVGGVEGATMLATQTVLSAPQPEILAVGTGDGSSPHQLEVAHIPVRLLNAAYLQGERRMRVVATAYSAAEPGASPWAASGFGRCEKGVIAVDPNVIPLGTHVYVPGYGYAIAADTGGMINGRHIDLCFDSMSELNAWGRRIVTIIILD